MVASSSGLRALSFCRLFVLCACSFICKFLACRTFIVLKNGLTAYLVLTSTAKPLRARTRTSVYIERFFLHFGDFLTILSDFFDFLEAKS